MKTMDTSEILKIAEQLSSLIRQASSERNMVEAEIEELTRKCDDITHRIERPDCKYKERVRLATQLAEIRRRRRELKDWHKNNQPYFKYIGEDDGEKMQRMLGNLVGIGRKVRNTFEMQKAMGTQND